MKDIDDVHYWHGKRVHKDFKIKKLRRIPWLVCLKRYIIVSWCILQLLKYTFLNTYIWSCKISFSTQITIGNHCVKRVRIRSYSGPHFSRIFSHSDWYLFVFSPNTGKYGKNVDQNNSEYRLFLRSTVILLLWVLQYLLFSFFVFVCFIFKKFIVRPGPMHYCFRKSFVYK